MILEEALADARATFPHFPEQIFTLWLDDRIRQNGWPPAGIEWTGFLDGMPITYWQSLRWHRAQVTLRPEELTATAFSVVMQLVEAATGKSNMMSSYIPNTVERFKACLQYIQNNATTPGTIILHRSAMGTSIVEGNHRIAALLAAQSQLPRDSALLPFDAWVASTPR